jgi:formylglycine-generating enzyme required for sulfatase activity
LLATRQQEQTRIVAALEARAKDLEARLQAAETRVDATKVDATKEESRASHDITVALEPPRERGAARPADRQAAAPQWESAPAATTVRIEVREAAPAATAARIDVREAAPAATTARIDVREAAPAATTARIDVREYAPIAAPKSKRPTQFPEFPLFGSRRGPAATIARFALVVGALAALAAVIWIFIPPAPVAENVSAVVSAAPPKPGSVIRDCATCPALTIVPAGRFKQGSARADGTGAAFERPLHWVLIAHPFAISTSAVTVDEFRPFIAATGRDMRGCDTYEDRWRIRPDASWENPGFVQTGSHPVTCVSWDDAKAYAGWLSRTTGHRYRLPSAAEWEYAARAGAEAVRPWNADESGACANANVADQRAARRYPGWAVFPCDDGYVYTAPVGSFKANSFGLNDMLGNVFQWSDDCWHADYAGVPTDGSSRTYGDCSERELRGGSWFTTPEFVRASYRNHFGVNYRASSVGIRLIRDIAP